jgi:hypothetical protein
MNGPADLDLFRAAVAGATEKARTTDIRIDNIPGSDSSTLEATKHKRTRYCAIPKPMTKNDQNLREWESNFFPAPESETLVKLGIGVETGEASQLM